MVRAVEEDRKDKHMDIERFVEELCETALLPPKDTLARQVADGRVSKEEAQKQVMQAYSDYLRECMANAPVDIAVGLEQVGVRVPTLIFSMG